MNRSSGYLLLWTALFLLMVWYAPGLSLATCFIVTLAATAVVGLGALFDIWSARHSAEDNITEVPLPEVATVVLKGTRRHRVAEEEPLLSSKEMIISGEISLLSDEDLAQLETRPIPVSKEDSAASDPEAPEAFDLDSLVRKLRSRMLTPLDYEFPPFMEVVDRAASQTIRVSLVGRRSPTAEFDFTDGMRDETVMKWEADCTRCEAFLFVRPFVRVLWPKEEWAIDHLRSMRGTVMINDEPIAEDVPIDSWIVNLDGHRLTGLPYSFVPPGRSLVLWGHATPIPADGEPLLRELPMRWSPPTPPPIGAPLGPALPDDTRLTISLSRASCPALRIVVGCVMGVYSTAP